jgi:gliding motility-associated-like protein
VLNRFEGSSIISSSESNKGAGTYTYTANTGLYSDKNVSYVWRVDGVQVGTNASYTATWTDDDEKTITLELLDTAINCTKNTHTILHTSQACTPPSITFATTSVCQNSDITVNFTGTLPLKLDYTFNGTRQTVTVSKSTTTFKATQAGNNAFVVHSLSDNTGCALLDSNPIPIAVTPSYNQTESITICDSDLPYTFRDITFPVGTISKDFVYNRKTVNTNCDSIVTVQLTVNSVLRRSINKSICEGETYDFYGTTLSAAVSGLERRFTNPGKCDSLVTLNLSVNPVLQRSINASICNGESYDFYGTAISTAVNGLKHRFSNAIGCDSVVTLNLTVHNINYEVKDASICLGETYDLNHAITDLQNTNVRFYLSPSDTGEGISPTVSPAINTVYYVKANNATGCFLDKKITITVAGKPSISLLPAIPAICEGGTVNLATPTVNDGGATLINPMWLLDGQEFDPNTPLSSFHHNQKLKYIADNACGTASSNEVTLFVMGQPDLAFTEYGICLGESVQLQAPENTSCLWLPMMSTERNPTVSPTETTTYTLRLTTAQCTADYPVTVTVFPLPTEVSVKQSGLNTVQIIADQPYIYRLDNAEATTHSIFESLSNGYHSLEISSAEGCSTRQSFFVYGLNIPEFFTPNGDEDNNLWEIENLQEFSNIKVYIYDRLGKLLDILDAGHPAWDGTSNGKEMPSTDYWYILEMPDYGEKITGHFTLKR